MLTKYILTIGGVEHEVPDECLKNWDEIAFSLKRTDYSGVMRSFSTQFVFVGEMKDLLWQTYLADGFLASASIAVYTITDTHTWELQFSSPLDFSTIETEEGTLTINAMDNALASLLKSKKSQKYEYAVGGFNFSRVNVTRMELSSYASYEFPVADNPSGYVTALLNDNGSQVISKEYIKPCDEVADAGYGSLNRFFATVEKSGADVLVRFTGVVRCYFCPYTKTTGAAPGDDTAVSYLRVLKGVPGEGTDPDTETVQGVLACDDIMHQVIHGTLTNVLVNYDKENVFATLNDLKAAAVTRYGTLTNEHNGIFGVVGSYSDYTQTSYWENNDIYEWQGGRWLSRGKAVYYYQDRNVADRTSGYSGSVTVLLPTGNDGAYLCLDVTGGRLYITEADMRISWSDPVRTTLSCRCIRPLELVNKLVQSIAGSGYTATIAEDAGGLLADTMLLAGEELRQITDAKIYATFKSFADWMEAVFGYTYRVVGTQLQFVHRSAVFVGSVAKTIGSFRDVKYSVVDDLIYSTVEAGYPKKEYGEIDGRLETNFTNYYTTGCGLTDRKLSLVSKFRADSYGVEFTSRKGESETTDDKADEDVFFISITSDAETGVNTYDPANQSVFAPSVCASNNEGFIAVLGNGAAVTLTMTSSDGNNVLTDIAIDAGDNLFTAGELEFTTDDMELPGDLNALVQLDNDGYRYKGFIKEAECRYGRVNGVEYKLIVKEITAL